MKDLKLKIAETQGNVNRMSESVSENLMLRNQISIMEALQDIQEKMMRMEGRTTNKRSTR
jgi:hypothetical protein